MSRLNVTAERLRARSKWYAEVLMAPNNEEQLLVDYHLAAITRRLEHPTDKAVRTQCITYQLYRGPIDGEDENERILGALERAIIDAGYTVRFNWLYIDTLSGAVKRLEAPELIISWAEADTNQSEEETNNANP
jgi:hypothetical protein